MTKGNWTNLPLKKEETQNKKVRNFNINLLKFGFFALIIFANVKNSVASSQTLNKSSQYTLPKPRSRNIVLENKKNIGLKSKNFSFHQGIITSVIRTFLIETLGFAIRKRNCLSEAFLTEYKTQLTIKLINKIFARSILLVLAQNALKLNLRGGFINPKSEEEKDRVEPKVDANKRFKRKLALAVTGLIIFILFIIAAVFCFSYHTNQTLEIADLKDKLKSLTDISALDSKVLKDQIAFQSKELSECKTRVRESIEFYGGKTQSVLKTLDKCKETVDTLEKSGESCHNNIMNLLKSLKLHEKKIAILQDDVEHYKQTVKDVIEKTRQESKHYLEEGLATLSEYEKWCEFLLEYSGCTYDVEQAYAAFQKKLGEGKI